MSERHSLKKQRIEIKESNFDYALENKKQRTEKPSTATQHKVDLFDLVSLPKYHLPKMDGLITGRLTKLNERGEPLVDFPGNPLEKPVAACSTVPVKPEDIERRIVLMFDEGNLRKPIIIGILRKDVQAATADKQDMHALTNSPECEIDGEKVVFTAEKEIVLRCGEASITLTSAGKVLIQGNYVLSSASGINQVQGNAVKIN